MKSRHHHLLYAEGQQWRERQRQANRRAVGVGDQRARPLTRCSLLRERGEMLGIDLRDYQRHIRLHAECRGVAGDERARTGKRWLDSFCLQGGQGREDEHRWRAVVGCGASQPERGCLGWHVALDPPLNDLAVLASRVALGGGHSSQPEPGMLGQHRDEPLAHESGRSQHKRWYSFRWGLTVFCRVS